MKTNKQELRDLGACEPGYKRFLEQTECTDDDVDVASLVGGENSCGDILWYLGYRLSKDRLYKFMRDCAILCVDNIREEDGKQAILEFLKSPNYHRCVEMANRIRITVTPSQEREVIYWAITSMAAYQNLEACSVSADAEHICDLLQEIQMSDEVNKLLIDMINEVD